MDIEKTLKTSQIFKKFMQIEVISIGIIPLMNIADGCNVLHSILLIMRICLKGIVGYLPLFVSKYHFMQNFMQFSLFPAKKV